MPATQIQVMDQNTGVGGHESCGYHTFKNSILTLMFQEGLIDESKFKDLLKEPRLFSDIFNKTKRTQVDGTIDLSVPFFIEILEKARNGEYDFSQYGISKEDLQALHLDLGNNADISVSSYQLHPMAPEHGLSGTEDDLFVAASAAKLARNKGVGHHVFAIGVVNPYNGSAHWITTGFTQDTQGRRTWSHLDSWRNQSTYLNTVMTKVEAVLTKSEPQLQAYLLKAYDGNSQTDLINRRYAQYFNDEGKAKNEFLEVTEYFIENKQTLKDYTGYIKNRLLFMDTAGWLDDGRVLDAQRQEELARMTQLYNLAKFLYENAEEVDIEEKAILKPACEQLRNALGKMDVLKNIHDAPIGELVIEEQLRVDPIQVVNPIIESPITLDEGTDPQVIAAINAVKHGTPAATEGFAAQFVNAIKWLWEGIKSIGERIGSAIAGLVH